VELTKSRTPIEWMAPLSSMYSLVSSSSDSRPNTTMMAIVVKMVMKPHRNRKPWIRLSLVRACLPSPSSGCWAVGIE